MSDRSREAETETDGVGAARAEVERNRERLSETLEALEGRLIETKSAIRDKVNVLRPVQESVRTRPWVAVAVAAGVGAALGAVFGRGDEIDVIGEDERRRRREWRRRRRARVHGLDSDAYAARISEVARVTSDERPRRGRGKKKKKSEPSAMGGVRKQLMGAIASAVVAGLKDRARNHGNGRSPARHNGRRSEEHAAQRETARPAY